MQAARPNVIPSLDQGYMIPSLVSVAIFTELFGYETGSLLYINITALYQSIALFTLVRTYVRLSIII